MTEPITFETVDVPPEVTGADGITIDEPTPDVIAPDFACEVCGVSLSYSGRGRHPKRCDEHRRNASSTPRTATRSRTAEVDSALARMEMLYNFATMGLFAVGGPEIALDFESRIEKTQLSNKTAFEADPRLTKRINATSRNAGMVVFLAGNAMLVGPSLRLVYEMQTAKLKHEKEAREVTPLFGEFSPNGQSA